MAQIDTTAAMERLVAFVNTCDFDDGRDQFSTPDALQAWLEAEGLPVSGARATKRDLEEAKALREGLRAALLAHDAHADDGDVSCQTTVALQLVIGGDGSVSLQPQGSGVAAALAMLVAPVPAAVADGTWMRAKACPKDTCQWAFYDRSKNRSRRWCSMEVCGNQEKTRAFRERQREDG